MCAVMYSRHSGLPGESETGVSSEAASENIGTASGSGAQARHDRKRRNWCGVGVEDVSGAGLSQDPGSRCMWELMRVHGVAPHTNRPREKAGAVLRANVRSWPSTEQNGRSLGLAKFTDQQDPTFLVTSQNVDQPGNFLTFACESCQK